MITKIYNCTASKYEITTEHFHPSGSVQYTTLFGCQASGYPSRFDLIQKIELMQV